MKQQILLLPVLILLSGAATHAEIKTTVEHNGNDEAKPDFRFKKVPSPVADDAGAKATITIIDGERDSNGGDVEKLKDGKLPTEQDQPEENFFFDAGTEGGRLLFDLGAVLAIKQVNTYSWHPNTRGPQVFKLYASDGKAEGFNGKPGKSIDPASCGWKLLANVNTKPKAGEEGGGQYGVSIAETDGALGKYRYLLFVIAYTENDDSFGNTFYSEIDVVEQK